MFTHAAMALNKTLMIKILVMLSVTVVAHEGTWRLG